MELEQVQRIKAYTVLYQCITCRHALTQLGIHQTEHSQASQWTTTTLA